MSDEPTRDAADIKRSIARKREHLAADLDLLRANVHEQLSVRGQIEQHPRVALGVLAALGAFGALMGLLVVRALRR